MDAGPALADLNASIANIMGRVATASLPTSMAPLGWHQRILSAGNRKFSGNAQQRKRGHLLHHGTLLYAFDLTISIAYVNHPRECPNIARTKSRRLCGEPSLAADRLKTLLANAWAHTNRPTRAREAVEHCWPKSTGSRMASPAVTLVGCMGAERNAPLRFPTTLSHGLKGLSPVARRQRQGAVELSGSDSSFE